MVQRVCERGLVREFCVCVARRATASRSTRLLFFAPVLRIFTLQGAAVDRRAKKPSHSKGLQLEPVGRERERHSHSYLRHSHSLLVLGLSEESFRLWENA